MEKKMVKTRSFFIAKGMLFGILVFYVILLLPGSVYIMANGDSEEQLFIKGFSWGWTGIKGEYTGDETYGSLIHLRNTGTNWIALAFAGHMKTRDSTDILFSETNSNMVTDKEIANIIKTARCLGFKILLKPVVNCMDDAWRATISFKNTEQWSIWWQNYERFLCHYLKIGIQNGIDMFCIGCEMRSTQAQEDNWRLLIKKIKNIYQGPIVYNANHDDVDSIKWWDAVDMIGISAYYPVGSIGDTSLDKMLKNWQPICERLELMSNKLKKKILFVEIGVRSAKTCSLTPWDWQNNDLPYDGEEQARYYEAAFQTFWDKSFFVGFFWWDWKARLYKREDAENDKDFGIFGKPAEKVLKKWNRKRKRNQSIN